VQTLADVVMAQCDREEAEYAVAWQRSFERLDGPDNRWVLDERRKRQRRLALGLVVARKHGLIK
jgi:hypothetical protein